MLFYLVKREKKTALTHLTLIEVELQHVEMPSKLCSTPYPSELVLLLLPMITALGTEFSGSIPPNFLKFKILVYLIKISESNKNHSVIFISSGVAISVVYSVQGKISIAMIFKLLANRNTFISFYFQLCLVIAYENKMLEWKNVFPFLSIIFFRYSYSKTV